MRSRVRPLLTALLGVALCPFAAHTGRTSITFLGAAGGSTSVSTTLHWIEYEHFPFGPDSSISSFAVANGRVLSDTSFDVSGRYEPLSVDYVLGGESLCQVAPAGLADSTHAVVDCIVHAYAQSGLGEGPLAAVSTLGVGLRYLSSAPEIYWEVRTVPYPTGGNPGPGPTASFSGLPVQPWAIATAGCVPNTGELDLGATVQMANTGGAATNNYGTWWFRVYLSDVAVVSVPARGAPGLALAAPRPNPAPDGVALDFTLPAPQAVRLEILDVGGCRVRTLAAGACGAGAHTVRWDGRDEHGARLAAGVYWARLAAGEETRTRRVVLLP